MDYSHYVTGFTRRDAEGRQEAACLTYVTPEQIAKPETVPTCWGCAMWLENLDFIDPQPDNQADRAASHAVEAA